MFGLFGEPENRVNYTEQRTCENAILRGFGASKRLSCTEQMTYVRL